MGTEDSAVSDVATLEQPKPFAQRLLRIPRLPSMAGFWQRFFALAFDLTVLSYGLWLLVRGAGDLAFRFPLATQLLSALLFLGYFAALNGPVGGGRTLGKRVFRMRTTTLEGGVPTWRQAVLRTALLFPFTIATHLVLPFLDLDPTRHGDSWLMGMTSVALVFAFMIANSSAIAFNGFKQGLHDHAAETFVHRDDEELRDFASLHALLGAEWRMHYRQPQFSSRITLLLVIGMFGWMLWQRDVSHPALKLQLEAAALPRPEALEGVEIRPQVFDMTGRLPTAASELPKETEDGSPAPAVPYAKVVLSRRAPFAAPAEELLAGAEELGAAYLRLFTASGGGPKEGYSGPVDVDAAVVQALRVGGVLVPVERTVATATFTVEITIPARTEQVAPAP